MLTALMLVFGFAAIVLVGVVHMHHDPALGPTHSLDCLDWRRKGLLDPSCPAHHGTDWFAPIETETP